jgi:hypothetical protein
MLLASLYLIAILVATFLLLRGSAFAIKYLEQWSSEARPHVFPRPSRCSRCGQHLGRMSRLRTFNQWVLGGWTCPGCGSEFDQLDRILIARAWNAHLRDSKARMRREDLIETARDGKSPVQKLFDE